ncbi:Uncharacterised protein [Raoultella terrigena]|jgi:hypothetical protein|uniref:Pyocin immunity protein n=1 Tax=Raoultella terrigena TaxID=577 RepID=A0A3P8KQA9_RAOTE|nr:DUF6392 family protein [Raoultella sp. Ech2A]MDJ1652310.1 DUF6392 family protein [Raoultella sp. Ech2A]VDR29351.1 Uncharacterised protein [Raoultella terrigena]
MTVNVEKLINHLGKTYQEIFDAGLIPYKTKPTGYPGDPDLTLSMMNEGIYLAFNREGVTLYSIELFLQNPNKANYRFPNELPSPLEHEMMRSWVHAQFGSPDKFLPPRKRLRNDVGYTDLFTVMDFHIPISMQVDYDLQEQVKEVAFIVTSEVRW